MNDGCFHRKSIRLKGFDYTSPGTYFLTICTAERQNILGCIRNGAMQENKLGQLVRARWMEIPAHFANIELDAFVVMPNHFHGMVHLRRRMTPTDNGPREAFGKPLRRSIATIVRTFKAAVTRDARSMLGRSTMEIWQRNYYERIVRDGKEYADTYRYICENPLRWESDQENLEIGGSRLAES